MAILAAAKCNLLLFVIPSPVGGRGHHERTGSCEATRTATATGGGTNIVTRVIDHGVEVGFIGGSLDTDCRRDQQEVDKPHHQHGGRPIGRDFCRFRQIFFWGLGC